MWMPASMAAAALAPLFGDSRCPASSAAYMMMLAPVHWGAGA